METWELGTPVLIELEDIDGIRKVAGMLNGADEDGLYIQATHMDVPAIHTVSQERYVEIAKKWAAESWVSLKLEMLSRGDYASLLRGRRWIEKYLTELECDELVEEARARQKYTFREYNVPVLTFVSNAKINLIQGVQDLAADLDIVTWPERMDEELEELVEGKVPPRESDEKVMDEDDGKDGSQEKEVEP